eukprot:gene22558-biopygen5763
MWRRRHHQDPQQAYNAPTHHIARQDTSLQWHLTLGLVPRLMGLTAGGLISQSQKAGKCTNSATGTIKLNDTSPHALKKCKRKMAPKAPGKMENPAPKAPGLFEK